MLNANEVCRSSEEILEALHHIEPGWDTRNVVFTLLILKLKLWVSQHFCNYYGNVANVCLEKEKR